MQEIPLGTQQQSPQKTPQRQILSNIGGNNCTITQYPQNTWLTHMHDAKIIVLDSGTLSSWCTLHKKSPAEILSLYFGNTPCIVLPSGERGKSRICFDLLLKDLFDYGLARHDRIYAIGGGATCDMVSFVASVYMRGIALTLVPSTLLSMVDASIGGKTAINFMHYKNMIGSFYPPSEIMIVPDFLHTLSPALIQDGLAEILKAGLLQDTSIINDIETHGKSLYTRSTKDLLEVWEALIWKAIQVKISVVEKDFKEQNIRAHLNLGHTFAHAHEYCARMQGKSISHGAAVGLGIRAAICLGTQVDRSNKNAPVSTTTAAFTSNKYAQKVYTLLDSFEYPRSYKGYKVKDLLGAMSMDKKRTKEGLGFILQKDMGDTHVRIIEPASVAQVLAQLDAE